MPVPSGAPTLRVAAAGDNLADAWRSVVPPLTRLPGGSVLVIGGGAKSIGLYAAGLAAAHHAGSVDYIDDDPARRRIAESFGARTFATGVPLMRMYAIDATLRMGVSHARAVLPDLLAFVERTGYAAEHVTTLTADWDDAPSAYAARTTKVVLQRDPL